MKFTTLIIAVRDMHTCTNTIVRKITLTFIFPLHILARPVLIVKFFISHVYPVSCINLFNTPVALLYFIVENDNVSAANS